MTLILGLALALIVFLMANGLYFFLNRPKVTVIDRQDRPNAALLVIDMQQDFTRASGRLAHNLEHLTIANHRINTLAAEAHQLGIPVVEISHAFTDPFEKAAIKLFANGAGVEGSPGLKRDDALTYMANYHVWKHHQDSFTAPMFTRFLEDHKIGHLFVTGQDATACVNATAKAALKRNFGVTLIEDAILARNGTKWQGMKEALLAAGATISANLAGDRAPLQSP